jgi:hypothetical protein
MMTSDFPVLPEWKRSLPSVWGEQDAVAWLRGCPRWMGWAGLVGVALVAHGLGLRFLFGPEAMLFPAWMLGLHVANVLMMRAGGALVLRAVWPGRGRVNIQRAAWCGAAVFACHPLLNAGLYEAQNVLLPWVTLFTQVAVAGVAGFALTGRLSWLAVVGPSIFMAGYGGELGFIYAGASTVVAALVLAMVHLPWSQMRGFWAREHRLILIGSLATTALVGPLLERWLITASSLIQSPDWPERLATQSTLFWAWVLQVVWPVGLNTPTPTATAVDMESGSMLAPLALALLVLAAIAGFGWRRARGTSLLLTLTLLPLLAGFILLQLQPTTGCQLYPAMPWAALLAGAGLSRIWSWRPPVMVIIMAILLSAQATSSARQTASQPTPRRLPNPGPSATMASIEVATQPAERAP